MIVLASDTAASLWGIAVVALAAAACTWLLRSAQFPIHGRALVAGALAGVLIGPTVLGRMLPEHHERIFSGGVPHREHRDYTRWLAENLPGALPHLTPEARQAQRERDARDLADAEDNLRRARWTHQRPMRIFAMAVVALALLAACLRPVSGADRRQGLVTAASAGVWSAALPGALAYLAAIRWWGASASEAALLAAAVAIGPWALSAIDRRAADDAEFGGARMMQTAGRIASALAIALALWGMWRARGIDGAALGLPLLALPASWLLRKPAPEDLFPVELVIATLAALVAIRFDVYLDFAIWPLIVLTLLADDGRWLGAFMGAMLVGGRPALRTMRLVMPAMAAGPTQLAVAALALHAWLLPERYALPLLAGAIVIEVTAPARRRMAERLTETEEEVEGGGLPGGEN